MKIILLLGCLLGITNQLIGQNLKIKKAEFYYMNYRFYEAVPIYKELIQKDQLSVDEFDNVYRHAAISADKSHDYNFEYEILSKLSLSKKFTFDDAFQYFNLSLFLGFYENANSLLNTPIIKNSTDSRKLTLDKYRGKVAWSEFLKDTLDYEIKPVQFNSGLGDFGAIYHPDGIVFSSAREASMNKSTMDHSNYLDVFIALKMDGNVQQLKHLESVWHDATASYDSINKIWYYAANLAKRNATELSTTGIFMYDEKTQTEIPFTYNSKDFYLAQPHISNNGTTLWFSSDRAGGMGKADIWYSIKTEKGWSNPVNAGSIVNTSENEMFPFYKDNMLYFSSNGHVGLGGLDLYSVTYSGGKASALSHLPANLNSNGDDFSFVLDKTGKKGYFSSNRTDFVDRIYSFKFKKLNFVFKAKLVADSKNVNFQKIPVLVKKNDKIIDTLYADKDGNFEFQGEKENKYSFEVETNKYGPVKEIYSTVGKTESDTTFRTMTLNSKFVTVNTLVLDEVTKKPLPNSKVDITDASTGEVKHFVSDEKGMIKVELPRNKDFDIHASHKGYIDDQSTLSTKSTDKEINDKVNMTMFVKGTKIKVENVFYDYGKATLRPESKNELNRLVDFLKENPSIKVELGSHTDSRGSDAQNLQLSQKRAQACVDYLISQGIDKSLLIAKGYGETKLLNKCGNGVNCSEDEHQMNRRTEIKVLSVE